MTRVIGLLMIAVGVAVAAAQEHSYTQADIENGARLYQSSCAGCHGTNGDMVPGIELQRGQFRRATSDSEIVRIIQSGIPGTTITSFLPLASLASAISCRLHKAPGAKRLSIWTCVLAGRMPVSIRRARASR